MIITLMWLTISIPFVAAAKEEIAKKGKIAIQLTDNNTDTEEESSNPLNGTEEKAPGNINLAEEFLHDHPTTEHFITIVSQYYNTHNAGIYEAFHGELLVPPPNRA
jgi:phosphoribosylformylglycinamidine (FGAM) synthase-like amidotransferase family enzyme